MSLEIRGLRISAAGRMLVDGVDLDVPDGGRLGLIGSSGSGKSLTAMTIGGLLPETVHVTGSIRWQGEDLIGATPRRLAELRGDRIGYVFQEPATALNPVMRIGKQLTEPVRLHFSVPRDRRRPLAVELARRVGLPDPERIVDRYPHELSGGQRQRVGIAMALANRPALLVADEPTTALDVTVQARILALFDTLVRDSGSSLLFISHDLAVVSQVVDRVAVMAEGRIVEEGAVADVFRAPQHPATVALVEAARASAALLRTTSDGPA